MLVDEAFELCCPRFLERVAPMTDPPPPGLGNIATEPEMPAVGRLPRLLPRNFPTATPFYAPLNQPHQQPVSIPSLPPMINANMPSPPRPVNGPNVGTFQVWNTGNNAGGAAAADYHVAQTGDPMITLDAAAVDDSFFARGMANTMTPAAAGRAWPSADEPPSLGTKFDYDPTWPGYQPDDHNHC